MYEELIVPLSATGIGGIATTWDDEKVVGFVGHLMEDD